MAALFLSEILLNYSQPKRLKLKYKVSIRPSPIAMASRDEATTHLDHLE